MGDGLDQWFAWIAADENGDLTWEDFEINDVAWSEDAFPGFANDNAGDYLGIDIQRGMVHTAFTDDRTGVLLSYASPVEPRTNQGPLPPTTARTSGDASPRRR